MNFTGVVPTSALTWEIPIRLLGWWWFTRRWSTKVCGAAALSDVAGKWMVGFLVNKGPWSIYLPYLHISTTFFHGRKEYGLWISLWMSALRAFDQTPAKNHVAWCTVTMKRHLTPFPTPTTPFSTLNPHGLIMNLGGRALGRQQPWEKGDRAIFSGGVLRQKFWGNLWPPMTQDLGSRHPRHPRIADWH